MSESIPTTPETRIGVESQEKVWSRILTIWRLARALGEPPLFLKRTAVTSLSQRVNDIVL